MLRIFSTTFLLGNKEPHPKCKCSSRYSLRSFSIPKFRVAQEQNALKIKPSSNRINQGSCIGGDGFSETLRNYPKNVLCNGFDLNQRNMFIACADIRLRHKVTLRILGKILGSWWRQSLLCAASPRRALTSITALTLAWYGKKAEIIHFYSLPISALTKDFLHLPAQTAVHFSIDRVGAESAKLSLKYLLTYSRSIINKSSSCLASSWECSNLPGIRDVLKL